MSYKYRICGGTGQKLFEFEIVLVFLVVSRLALPKPRDVEKRVEYDALYSTRPASDVIATDPETREEGILWLRYCHNVVQTATYLWGGCYLLKQSGRLGAS